MNIKEYEALALISLKKDETQSYQLISLLEHNPALSQIIVAGAKLSSESGELNDAIVKHISYGQPLDKLNIKEECGDLLWYITVILSRLGYTMEQAMEENIEKLKRRYPTGTFTEEYAAKRLDKITSTCKNCKQPEENCQCESEFP